MVEIFKTNVKNKRLANSILKKLHARLPSCRFNFDLEDCDRILRAQSTGCPIEVMEIVQIVKENSIKVSLFEE
jgi:hypothetical protein